MVRAGRNTDASHARLRRPRATLPRFARRISRRSPKPAAPGSTPGGAPVAMVVQQPGCLRAGDGVRLPFAAPPTTVKLGIKSLAATIRGGHENVSSQPSAGTPLMSSGRRRLAAAGYRLLCLSEPELYLPTEEGRLHETASLVDDDLDLRALT